MKTYKIPDICCDFANFGYDCDCSAPKPLLKSQVSMNIKITAEEKEFLLTLLIRAEIKAQDDEDWDGATKASDLRQKIKAVQT